MHADDKDKVTDRKRQRQHVKRQLTAAFAVVLPFVLVSLLAGRIAIDHGSPLGSFSLADYNTAAHVAQARRLRGDPTNTTVDSALVAGQRPEPPQPQQPQDEEPPLLEGSVVARKVFRGVALALGLSYMFLGLAIVCDDFFVASLEALSEYFSLSEGVAGATFMAAGSSAPELFTSIADTFFFHSSVGVGTIVGSAVFNILVIIAMSGAFAGAPLLIDWRPLMRDIIFYLVSIGFLFAFAFPLQSDTTTEDANADPVSALLNNNTGTPVETGEPQHTYGYVTKWESLAFVCWYLLYISFMVFNDRFFKLFGCANEPEEDAEDEDIATSGAKTITTVISMQPGSASDIENGMTDAIKIGEKESEKEQKEAYTDKVFKPATATTMAIAVQNPMHLSATKDIADITAATSATDSNNASAAAKVETETDGDGPKSPIDRVLSLLSAPWTFVFSYSIPDCSSERWGKYFLVTFSMSCLWIGLLSWLLVFCATEFGKLVHINAVLMGVVFLAAGTSVPDAISSIVVAKEGKGSMAVANAIGSNVFDICLGIGLPYLISTGIMGRPPVQIATENLKVNVMILVGTVVVVAGTLAVSKWRLTKNVSWVLMILYVAFVAYNLIVQ